MVSDVFARIQIHIFATLICLVMLVETQNHKDSGKYPFRLFRAQLIACMLLLGSEAASWSSVGETKFFWNTVCFALHAFPGYLFSLYADYQLGASEEQLRRNPLPRLVPLLLAEVLVVANLFVPLLFSVDSNGFYRRESWFLVDTALSYSYLGYSFIRVVCNRREMDRLLVRPLILFHIIPFVGGAIQVCFYGSGFTLPSFALALLICYVYIQQRQLGTDYLTSACNRLQADKELRERMQGAVVSPFSVLILDINNFKKINDQFGHAVGDGALIETVQLLQRTLRRSDTLARYGGDEFLIISDANTPDSLQQMIERIHQAFSLFNQQADRPYQLNLSIGQAIYDPASRFSQEQLLAVADSRMYQNKMETVEQSRSQ